jgi:hypothetical protein
VFLYAIKLPCIVVSLLVVTTHPWSFFKCTETTVYLVSPDPAQQLLIASIEKTKQRFDDITRAECLVEREVMAEMRSYPADQSQADNLKRLILLRSSKAAERITMSEARVSFLEARSMCAPSPPAIQAIMLQLARQDLLRNRAVVIYAKAATSKKRAENILRPRPVTALIQEAVRNGKLQFQLTLNEIEAFIFWLSLKYEYMKYYALGEHRKPDTIVSNFRILN